LGRQVLLSDAEVDKLLTARAGYFGAGTPEIARSEACPVSGRVAAPPVEPAGGLRARDGERFWVSRAELEKLIAEAIESSRRTKDSN
jgi:hypothetical protein